MIWKQQEKETYAYHGEVVSHCFGILVILMTFDKFRKFPLVFVAGALYIILDLVHHCSSSNKYGQIVVPASTVLAISLGLEFMYRLYKEKNNLSLNLLFLNSTVIGFLIYIHLFHPSRSVPNSPLVRKDDHAIYHIFVWLLFYAVVTGKTSLYDCLYSVCTSTKKKLG